MRLTGGKKERRKEGRKKKEKYFNSGDHPTLCERKNQIWDVLNIEQTHWHLLKVPLFRFYLNFIYLLFQYSVWFFFFLFYFFFFLLFLFLFYFILISFLFLLISFLKNRALHCTIPKIVPGEHSREYLQTLSIEME